MSSISIDKKSVEDFFRGGQTSPFLIPEYQRPYVWTRNAALTHQLKRILSTWSDDYDAAKANYDRRFAARNLA